MLRRRQSRRRAGAREPKREGRGRRQEHRAEGKTEAEGGL